MKKQLAHAPLAAAALILSTTAIYADGTDTRSVSASVQGALQAPTGFLTGGQVQVSGVGQGSVVLNRGVADVQLYSGASSAISSDATGGVPQSSSNMVTAFDFDRTVETAGALVGIGSVVAQGESLGGVGIVGSSNANATRAGTNTTTSSSGSAATPTTAQGSMVADFTTTNTMQLNGAGSLFAGAQTLAIGERNAGVSIGRTGTISADTDAIMMDDLSIDLSTPLNASMSGSTVTGSGAGFKSISVLDNGADSNSGAIDMNVSNAGNGSVLVSASTGGFFGEGTAFGASANPTFSQVGGFFDAVAVVE